MSPVHQAVALDALVVHIVTSDFAGIAAVSLYGIDPAAVCADDDAHMDGSADHVGIVVGTDGSRVYTVEGNSGDACKIKSYSLTYECIKGYGLMNW